MDVIVEVMVFNSNEKNEFKINLFGGIVDLFFREDEYSYYNLE